MLLDTQTGDILDTSSRLPFSIYGTAVDAESGWLAAAGNERTDDHLNVALLHLQRTERSFRLGAEAPRTFGVGRVSRGSRIQANSVRFGCSLQPSATGARVVRVLLVGSQDRFVYVFAIPAAGSPQQNTLPLVQHRYETAVNCAAASPDGRWLAATGDTDAVYVVGSETGYLDTTACVSFALPITRRQRLFDEAKGAQYCVWSADGQRLAASSDTLHAVAVWAVPPPGAPLEFVPLARFAEFAQPALALTFLPPSAAGAHLLAWSELDSNVYVADVDFAGASDAWNRPLRDSCGEREMRARGVQRISLPPPPAPPHLLLASAAHLSRITGLCCAGGALFVAQTARITKFPILAAWCVRCEYRAVSSYADLMPRTQVERASCTLPGGIPQSRAHALAGSRAVDAGGRVSASQSACVPSKRNPGLHHRARGCALHLLAARTAITDGGRSTLYGASGEAQPHRRD